jgi:hypothetical protein
LRAGTTLQLGERFLHGDNLPISELFVRWRELIGPYFAAAPEVEHFESPAVTG